MRRRATNYSQEDNFILGLYHQDLLPGNVLGADRSTIEPEQCRECLRLALLVISLGIDLGKVVIESLLIIE